MTTVKDLGVTEGAIRDYVLRKDKDALTEKQLEGICYDYLQKVIRDPNHYPKWPKDLENEMASRGILMDKYTGLPKADGCMQPAWSSRTGLAESEAMQLREQIEKLTDKIEGLYDISQGFK